MSVAELCPPSDALEDIDVWMSFSVEDPGPLLSASGEATCFDASDCQPSATNAAAVTEPLTVPPTAGNDEALDLDGFLIEDLEIAADALDDVLFQNPKDDFGQGCSAVAPPGGVPEAYGAEAPQVTVVAPTCHSPLGAIACHSPVNAPACLSPGGALASPRRSASSMSDGAGESMGSNVKCQEHGSTGDASTAPGGGGSSSDGERLQGHQTPQSTPFAQMTSVSSASAVPPMQPMMGATMGAGVTGAHQFGFPGYPIGAHPAPVMFHPMMPFPSRSLPRRNRKAPARQSSKEKVEGKKKEGSKKEASSGAVLDSKVKDEPVSGEEKLDGAPTGSGGTPGCSPQSGVSAEDVKERKVGSDSSDDEDGTKDGDWEKRQARLMRNRESAQLSRQRKKFYMEELEVQLRTMAATVAELNNTIAHLTAENVSLRRQLAYYCPTGVVPGGAPGAAPGGLQGTPCSAQFSAAPMAVGMGGGAMMGFRSMFAPKPVVAIPKLKSTAKAEPARKAEEEKKRKSGSDGPGASCHEGAGKKPKSSKAPAKAASVAAFAVFGFFMFLSPFLPASPSGGSVSVSVPQAAGGLAASSAWSTWSPFTRVAPWASIAGGPSWAMRGLFQSRQTRGRVLMEDPGLAGWVPVVNQSSPFWHSGAARHSEREGSISAKGVPAKLHLGLNVSESGVAHVIQQWGNVTVPGGPDESGTHFPATLSLPGERGGSVEIDGQLIIRAVMAGSSAAALAGRREVAIPLGPANQETAEGTAAGQADSGSQLVMAEPKGSQVEASGSHVADKEQLVEGKSTALLPHQLKYLAMGSLDGHGKQMNAPRMWALPDKPSDSGTAGEAAGDSEGASSFSSAGWKGSFIGSEMCTEVFQFEVSRFSKPASAAAAADGKAQNNSKPNSFNSSSSTSGHITPNGSAADRGHVFRAAPSAVNRRLRGANMEPPSLPAAAVSNITLAEAQAPTNSTPNNGKASMVVSILAGVDSEGQPGHTKGISKVFVVVLVDGIKYVTYACLLPSFSVNSGASLIPL